MQTRKIYGPPGTGKTHYLLGVFEDELKTVRPDRIAFLTFTRAAKAEALSRASLDERDLPFVKTIHAICYELLKVRHDQLVLREDLKKFAKKIGVQLSGYMPDPLSLEQLTETWTQPSKADRLLQLNHLGRHRGMKLRETLRLAPLELDWNYAKWFTEAYRNWKVSEGKLDYTDLLTEYLARGPLPDIDLLFVDESQDLSWLQWQVIRKLQSPAQRRYIAGDDDQAIFIWAGASADMFNTEPADEIVVLPQSHRIPRAVHDIAGRIIKRVRTRQPKEFKPRDVAGIYRPVGYLDRTHLNGSKTLVLYRNFHRGSALAQQLEEIGIPFSGSLSPLSNPDVQAAIEGWIRCLKPIPVPVHQVRALLAYANPHFVVDGVKEKASQVTGELSATSIFKPEAFRKDWFHVLPRMPRLGYIDKIQARGSWDDLLKPKVELMSIHQSKGREAETVILDLEMARRTYEAYMHDSEGDEHRVWYVAVTRARERLLTLMPTDTLVYQI